MQSSRIDCRDLSNLPGRSRRSQAANTEALQPRRSGHCSRPGLEPLGYAVGYNAVLVTDRLAALRRFARECALHQVNEDGEDEPTGNEISLLNWPWTLVKAAGRAMLNAIVAYEDEAQNYCINQVDGLEAMVKRARNQGMRPDLVMLGQQVSEVREICREAGGLAWRRYNVFRRDLQAAGIELHPAASPTGRQPAEPRS